MLREIERGLRRLVGRPFRVWPPVGRIRWGDLGGSAPISRKFGFERGRCVDRYYIERFLASHAADIRGHVLEMADPGYTRKFGGDRVTKSDVLHLTADNPQATLVGDLAAAEFIPADSFDCIILTQTLPFIYEPRAALCHLRRILRPQGVLLVTVPGISHISRWDMERGGDYWRFTSLAVRRLFAEFFTSNEVAVESYGNVLAAVALLQGLAVADLPAAALLE